MADFPPERTSERLAEIRARADDGFELSMADTEWLLDELERREALIRDLLRLGDLLRADLRKNLGLVVTYASLNPEQTLESWDELVVLASPGTQETPTCPS